MAAEQSEKIGWLTPDETRQVIELVHSAHLPTGKPEELSGEEMLKHMQVDKKVMDGTIRLVLMRALGDAVVTGEYPRDTLLSTLGVN